MIAHLPVLPVVIPALFAAVMLLDRRLAVQRMLALASVVLLVLATMTTVSMAADGWRGIYLLGNWAPPWGIVLVADRLSSLMMLVTAVLALIVLAAARSGWDSRGEHFHPLLQIQLMGLNGAFLTGDVFNLFVFFEVLLIASYGLLVHGDGRSRVVAGMRFVTLNLLGSTLFLFAAAILYGVAGTLNMADLGERLPALEGMNATLGRSGVWLLMVVFLLKSAILPLYFWLPGTYGAAGAPVAALFAVMTKVGLYSVLRVQSLLSGGTEPIGEADSPVPWLAILAAASFGLAMLATLAGRDLRRVTSMLVISSAGLLLAGITLATEHAIAASLYYLVHTTFSAAAMFLVADLVSRSRVASLDRIEHTLAPAQPALVGGLFFIAAAAMVGLPPFGGFIGKAMLLQATLPMIGSIPDAAIGAIWFALLGGTLLGVIALSRAGSRIFWKAPAATAATAEAPRLSAGDWAPAAAALAVVAVVGIAAAPLQRFTLDAARDLLDPSTLIQQTLTERPIPGPHTPEPETRR
jgi:multicomponent K+:H+ antiporter subunit D